MSIPWSGVLGCLRGSAFFARMRTIGTLSQGAVRKAHKRLLSWDQSSPKRWNTLMGGMSWTDIRPLCSSCIVSICLYDTPAASEISWDSRLRMPDCLGIYFFWTWIRNLNDQWHSVQDKLPMDALPMDALDAQQACHPWPIFGKSHRIWLLRFNAKLNLCRTPGEDETSRLKRLVASRALNIGSAWSANIFINIMGAISHIAPCLPDVPPGWSELEGQSGAMWICHC